MLESSLVHFNILRLVGTLPHDFSLWHATMSTRLRLPILELLVHSPSSSKQPSYRHFLIATKHDSPTSNHHLPSSEIRHLFLQQPQPTPGIPSDNTLISTPLLQSPIHLIHPIKLVITGQFPPIQLPSVCSSTHQCTRSTQSTGSQHPFTTSSPFFCYHSHYTGNFPQRQCSTPS